MNCVFLIFWRTSVRIKVRLERYFLQYLKLMVLWSCQLSFSQHWDYLVLCRALLSSSHIFICSPEVFRWVSRGVIFYTCILFSSSDTFWWAVLSLLALSFCCNLLLPCIFVLLFKVNCTFFILSSELYKSSPIHLIRQQRTRIIYISLPLTYIIYPP